MSSFSAFNDARNRSSPSRRRQRASPQRESPRHTPQAASRTPQTAPSSKWWEEEEEEEEAVQVERSLAGPALGSPEFRVAALTKMKNALADWDSLTLPDTPRDATPRLNTARDSANAPRLNTPRMYTPRLNTPRAGVPATPRISVPATPREPTRPVAAAGGKKLSLAELKAARIATEQAQLAKWQQQSRWPAAVTRAGIRLLLRNGRVVACRLLHQWHCAVSCGGERADGGEAAQVNAHTTSLTVPLQLSAECCRRAQLLLHNGWRTL